MPTARRLPQTLGIARNMHRLACSDDFDAVYSIYMHEEVVPFLGFDPMSRNEFEPIFLSLLKSGQFFVVECGGIVKGFYRVSRHEGRASHTAYLSTVAILPEEKGSGLALRMMKEAIGNLKAQGVLRVELMLEADNPRALAFYEKLGFEYEGTLKAAYKRAEQMQFTDELFLGMLLSPIPCARDA